MSNEFIWRQDLVRYVLVGCEDGIIAGHTLTDMRNIFACLHDEVEILEEEKKIPEKLSTWFSVETKQSKELNIEYANTNFENMYEKINEIIDYLKSKGE